VVDDSNVGIEAALAAKMKAVQFRPNNDSPYYTGAMSIIDMMELPDLVNKIEYSDQQ
jgi:beta-phosphoglucomutase-like phosphatase (HAD superfamily)